jgi:hypothetical protein
MQDSRTHRRRAGLVCQGAGLVLFGAMQTTPGSAAQSRTDMHVRAAVPLEARIVETVEPGCLAATPNVAGGAALRGRVVYTIRSTSRSGIELAFQPATQVRRLEVRIVGATGYVPIPDLGGEITLRGHPVGEADLEVEYRVAFDESVQTGCTPLPVHVEARPL